MNYPTCNGWVAMRFAVCLLVTSVLTTLPISSVGAEPARGRSVSDGAVVEPDGTVRYEVDLSALPGAVIHHDRGKKKANGACGFLDSGSGQAGQPRVLVVKTLAVNPATCERETARAEYLPDALPDSVRGDVELPNPSKMHDSTSKSEALGAPSSDMTSVAGPWYGSLQARVEDPPNWDVTVTKSELTWWTEGSWLYSDHTSNWSWLERTGWFSLALNNSFDNDGNYASTNTFGDYANILFCKPSVATYTDHSDTLFRGTRTGAWSWSYYVEWWGDCADLLDDAYTVVTP